MSIVIRVRNCKKYIIIYLFFQLDDLIQTKLNLLKKFKNKPIKFYQFRFNFPLNLNQTNKFSPLLAFKYKFVCVLLFFLHNVKYFIDGSNISKRK